MESGLEAGAGFAAAGGWTSTMLERLRGLFWIIELIRRISSPLRADCRRGLRRLVEEAVLGEGADAARPNTGGGERDEGEEEEEEEETALEREEERELREERGE